MGAVDLILGIVGALVGDVNTAKCLKMSRRVRTADDELLLFVPPSHGHRTPEVRRPKSKRGSDRRPSRAWLIQLGSR